MFNCLPGCIDCNAALPTTTGSKISPSCWNENSFWPKGSLLESSMVRISSLTGLSLDFELEDSIKLIASLSEIPSSNWNSTKGKISKDTKLWTKGWPQLLHRLPPLGLYNGFVVEHLKSKNVENDNRGQNALGWDIIFRFSYPMSKCVHM